MQVCKTGLQNDKICLHDEVIDVRCKQQVLSEKNPTGEISIDTINMKIMKLHAIAEAALGTTFTVSEDLETMTTKDLNRFAVSVTSPKNAENYLKSLLLDVEHRAPDREVTGTRNLKVRRLQRKRVQTKQCAWICIDVSKQSAWICKLMYRYRYKTPCGILCSCI
jgi:hypothetical protein